MNREDDDGFIQSSLALSQDGQMASTVKCEVSMQARVDEGDTNQRFF
jgi:hypothetical protein